MVSMGGPVSLRISVRSGWSPTVWGLSERVIVSGLYCRLINPSGIPRVESTERIAPFCSLGEMLAIGRAFPWAQALEDPASQVMACLDRAGSVWKLACIQAIEAQGAWLS